MSPQIVSVKMKTIATLSAFVPLISAMAPADTVRHVKRAIKVQDGHADEACDLSNEEVHTFLNDRDVCSAASALLPANMTEATGLEMVTWYEELCSSESYACFEALEGYNDDRHEETACVDYKAANPEAVVSNPGEYVCSRLDAETLCISAFGPAFFELEAPEDSCEAKHGATWNNPSQAYICCSLAELGCCLPTILASQMSVEERTNWVQSVNDMCYSNTSATYSGESCELDRTKATYFFEVEVSYSVLIGDWEPAVLGDIATTYGVDVSTVNIISAVGATGSEIIVKVSIRVHDSAALDALATTAASTAINQDEVDAVVALEDPEAVLNLGIPVFGQKVVQGESSPSPSSIVTVGIAALVAAFSFF